MNKKNNFQFVNYLWDEQKANSLGDNQVELFLYRSNILGADLRITNYGGGNTSCKTIEKTHLLVLKLTSCGLRDLVVI